MCGVAGLLDKKNKNDRKKLEVIVKSMLCLMQHRGGDAIGVQTVNSVTMGHTRLSIVDPTSQADQPFYNTHSVFSFNGEIYNHQKLRRKYLGNAEIFTHSDTATLFALLERLSIKTVLKAIQGMFAFSYFNARRNSLILALDRHAIKPLYYIDTPDYFAWASEAKAFGAIPRFTFQFQDKHISEYMIFRYVAGENTLFKNVYKLQPGEYLTYSRKNKIFKKQKYYELSNLDKVPLFNEKILEKSVKDHLMGDIAAGVQLSGGVDSSIVALLAKKCSKADLHTFSIGLQDSYWNEFDYSDLVARKLKTIHHKIIFSKNDFVKLLPKITYHLDEPLVHPNTVPMYLLAKEARKYTKVLLTGEGADEVFYGYKRYFNNIKNEAGIILSNAFNDPQTVNKILKDSHLSPLNRQKMLRFVKKISLDKKVSLYDLQTYLPHVLLRQDKAGMAANIENRVPFLHKSVVESGLNSLSRIGRLGGKNSVKKIALKYFPQELVLRRKCGFGLPVSEWLIDPDCLLPQLSKLTAHKVIKKYFSVKETGRLIREHVDGKNNHSSTLLTLLSLVIWYDVFIGSTKGRNLMRNDVKLRH